MGLESIADADPTMVSTVTDAISGLGPQLLTVAAAGLAIGASIFGLKKGWGLVKKFIN